MLKAFILLLLSMLLLMMITACSSVNEINYIQPEQLNDGIKTGHLAEVGFDLKLVAALKKQPFKELHSLLVYKDGLLVVEEYFHGNNDFIEFENNITRNSSQPPIQWHRDKKHYVASVNKALTATVTGIALDKFEITIDSKIASLLPTQYQPFFNGKNANTKNARTENMGQLSIRHLLTMQTGFEWDEWGSDDLAKLWSSKAGSSKTGSPKARQSKDFAEFVLSRPNHGPGADWQYNSAGPNLLLRGLENHLQQPIRQWAHQHFYAKLGITDYDWQSQPDGYPEGSAKMWMRPRDMLKVGITYLNKGQWQGEQVIPASWVEAVSTVQASSDAGDYSYLFWLRELAGHRYLSADGDGGQYINIFPAQNLVIVMTQGNYLEWPLYVKQAEQIMGWFVFGALDK